MSIQKIIQESINGNPLEMKEALQEELRDRIRLALEAKMNEDMSEEVEELDESEKKIAALEKKLKDHQNRLELARERRRMKGGSRGVQGSAEVNIYRKMDDISRQIHSLKHPVKEEVEQIDELKKSTLASYISKASDNAASHAIKYGEKKAQSDEMDRMMNRHMSYDDKDKMRSIMKTTNKDVNEPREKAAKRLYGISRAAKKLAKEEFDLSDLTLEELEDFMESAEFDQLDEISKNTLRSYVKKNMDHHPPTWLTPLRDVERRKSEYYKRLKGFGRATDKLTGRARVNATEEFDLSDLTLEELEGFMESAEFDQLDELDKKTLTSYVKKASKDAASKSGTAEYEAGRAHDKIYNQQPDHSSASFWTKRSQKSSEKAGKRLQGISRATDRLAK